MAKKSAIARNKKRERLAELQKERRAELRKKLKDPNLGFEEKQEVMFKLQSLPRNGARVRVLNRCLISGRPKAVYRKFKVSRIVLRELAHQGMIPGMKKASW
ncbi:MAG: 30S ribosomal protein S14 [Vulcanimicrobiota bacterium]